MKYLIALLLVITTTICLAQNKSGNNFVVGNGCIQVSLQNDTTKPTLMQRWPIGSSKRWFNKGHSMISDSANGRPIFFCNGYILFDTLGNIIKNGDSLVPSYWYNYNIGPYSNIPQATLILPKGSSGQYYLFTVSNTDSYINYLLSINYEYPYNLLEYHVIDMNANNGAGEVVQKHIPLITNKKLSRTGMQACRHANGIDWWLVKQASYDSNYIYRWLVKADTIIGPEVQVFENIFSRYDLLGQSAFSKQGTQYVFGTARRGKIFLADFNRCTGAVSNVKILQAPVDSTGDPFHDNVNDFDSLICGLAFSPNDSFLYVAKYYNIYQYDLYAHTWYRVAHLDTTLQKFDLYGNLLRGVDGRIYIGKYHGTSQQNSIINYPNKKGVACGWCPKCLRYTLPNNWGTNSPSNMPDFTLGADSSSCWPLASGELLVVSGELKVYPNPANNIIFIETKSIQKRELYNCMGQLVYSTLENKIDVSRYGRGFYFVKVGSAVQKIILE
jgi:Secretion system C-terminal sorting domain